jgi:hypothetical protein
MENTSETYGIWESISSKTSGRSIAVLACELTCSAISDLNMHLQLYLRFTWKLPHVASEGFWIARAPIEFVST